MSKDTRKSLFRSKKTILRLSDFAIESSAGLVPGGVPIYKLSKFLFRHIANFIDDRREKRLINFHKKVLVEGDHKYWEIIKDKDIPIDEYYSILNSVVQDEEEKKIEIYAKIFRLILLEKIPNKYRTHIIKSVRELIHSDFELMRNIYINETHQFRYPGSHVQQIKEITQTEDSLQAHSIQTLIRFGYLTVATREKPPWPTDLLKMLVECLFKPEELKA